MQLPVHRRWIAVAVLATAVLVLSFIALRPAARQDRQRPNPINGDSVAAPPPPGFRRDVGEGKGKVNVADLSRQPPPKVEAVRRSIAAPVGRRGDVTLLREQLPPRGPGAARAPIRPLLKNIPTVHLPDGPKSPEPTDNFEAVLDDGVGSPPADPHGAVGPNHLVVAHNSGLVIQDCKTGKTLFRLPSLDAFWNEEQGQTFDPRVIYDHFDSRWVLTAAAGRRSENSRLLVAVSVTGDPAGDWFKTTIPINRAQTPGERVWIDYPVVGFNSTRLVVQGNLCPVAGPDTETTAKVGVYVLEKRQLYEGVGNPAVNILEPTTASKDFTSLVPAVCLDDTADIYLVQSATGNKDGNGYLQLWVVTGPPEQPQFRPVNPWNPPAVAAPWRFSAMEEKFAPQKNALSGEEAVTAKIHLPDDRIQNVVYRGGTLWCTQTVFIPFGKPDDVPTRSVIQWWQLTTTGEILQCGRIGDGRTKYYRATPSLAVNDVGDVLIGYARFAADEFPSAAYALHHHSDPPGTHRAEHVFKHGESEYNVAQKTNGNPWGDYSSTVVDPASPARFWTLQKYAAKRGANGCGWGIQWASVVPPLAVVVEPTGKGSVPPSQKGEKAGGAVKDVKTVVVSPFPKTVPAAAPDAESLAPRTPPAEPTAVPEEGKGSTDFVQVLANRALSPTGDGVIKSLITEPSVAAWDRMVFVTGNHFTGFSQDAGLNYQFKSPDTYFPRSEGVIDQVVQYDPKRKLLFWVFQTTKAPQRLVLAVVANDDIPKQAWHFYELTPDSIRGMPKGAWFDFPDLVLGRNSLYVTANVFSEDGTAFVRSVVLRVPLARLAAREALEFDYYESRDSSPGRLTRGVDETVYWASHADQSTLRVCSWAESSPTVLSKNIRVDPWVAEMSPTPGPDGRNWLERCDSRITAAWVTDDSVGFGWTAGRGGPYPFPHVRSVILDRKSLTVRAQPHIWSKETGYAYAAAAPNSAGRIGLSAYYGGGRYHPSHAVGILRPAAGGRAAAWDLVPLTRGTSGPRTEQWGDYLGIQPHGTQPETWVTAAATLQGGAEANNIEVRYVHFGPTKKLP